MEDELKEVRKLINKARHHAIQENELTQQIFKILNDLEINIEATTESYNADNLSEAITCYIHYGEFDVNSIIKEIKSQISKK